MDRSEILGGWALPPDAWLAVVRISKLITAVYKVNRQDKTRQGSPSLAAALITCGGVESRLQRKGCDSDFQQNEAHNVTLVTSTPAPRMLIPL